MLLVKFLNLVKVSSVKQWTEDSTLFVANLRQSDDLHVFVKGQYTTQTMPSEH
jgi:ferredoxin-NADP reductase